MSVTLDQSADAEFLRFVARFCGVNLGSAASGRLRVRLGRTTELYEASTIAKYLARFADRELELLGQTPFERAQVAMWLDFARGIQRCPPAAAPTHWQVLEASLQHKTYLAANRVTLADAALFYTLHAAVGGFSQAQRDQFASLVRWFDQVQHTAGVRGFRSLDVVDLSRKPIAFTA
ncbi:Eukaryotic translation elongation factor 1 epsilon-1 [Phytophthora pseudosyringae]|uniref:Eukaryotic translation elongation factor 1 epsilon-1 n=1 Tax=Phytophthora pseudosyringae TaxID=221518 RepID=A0A8T1WD62_9STRA|nr:Eukaryotic translation elongation factor 1 epsilon-1 [Phytophthora pseudosyringae]